MTKRDVAIIGCRLLAIYCLVSAVGLSGGLYQASVTFATLSSFNGGSSNNNSWFIAFVAFGPSVLQLMCGIFLWMFSNDVAAIVAAEERGVRAVAAWDKDDLKSVVVFVLGLYFLVVSLPGAAQVAIIAWQFFMNSNRGPAAAGGSGDMWYAIARSIKEMLCGMMLIIISHFISRRGKAANETPVAHPQPDAASPPAA